MSGRPTAAMRIAAISVLILAPFAADAQSFRCTGKDGKRYYGQTVPPQCSGQVLEQLNAQGMVIRRIDPEGDERAREAKEAEQAKKREEDAANREASRRNRALLATYSTEKDIDEARARALAANDKAIEEIQGRIQEIKKRRAGYEKEMEFYQDGTPKTAADAKSKSSKPQAPPKTAKPPPKLVEDMRNAEVDLKAQQGLLDAKQKEVDSINAKYAEDKKRYAELTGGRTKSGRK
jgi:hypothetical protein